MVPIKDNSSLKDFKKYALEIKEALEEVEEQVEFTKLLKDFLEEKSLTLYEFYELENIFNEWKKGNFYEGFIITKKD